ncbi:MAG: hypothetical protein ACRED8_01185 [Caulobacteraceae bacterium]
MDRLCSRFVRRPSVEPREIPRLVFDDEGKSRGVELRVGREGLERGGGLSLLAEGDDLK